jgi:hypothetical protein
VRLPFIVCKVGSDSPLDVSWMVCSTNARQLKNTHRGVKISRFEQDVLLRIDHGDVSDSDYGGRLVVISDTCWPL